MRENPYAEEVWRGTPDANEIPELGEYHNSAGERMVVDYEEQDALWSVCYWGADGAYNGAEHFGLYSSLKKYVLDRTVMDGYHKVCRQAERAAWDYTSRGETFNYEIDDSEYGRWPDAD